MKTNQLSDQLQPEVLERFLRYVQIDTQSQDDLEKYPSTDKQLKLAELLVEELKDLGIEDASMDKYGYVMATLLSNSDKEVPAMGLIAHLDTSPEASGKNVKPQIIKNYQGGEIILPATQEKISPQDSPALNDHLGHDLITADGTTLLGGDDKAGVAEIITAVSYLLKHPEIKHGPVRVAFTPDEEVGKGTEYFDIEKFGVKAAYTVDGGTVGEIEDETFSASAAVVTIKGHNTHPGYGKGKLVNSVKLAGWLLSQLPQDSLSPETTDGKQGYIHPNVIDGGVEKTVIKFIVRDFDKAKLKEHEELIKKLCKQLEKHEPRAKVEVEITQSYSNMKEYLKDHQYVLKVAEEAVKRAGISPIWAYIRGGTDGARLSQQGLPTPNLFTGAQDYHSTREWISIQDLALSTATLVHLVQVWSNWD